MNLPKIISFMPEFKDNPLWLSRSYPICPNGTHSVIDYARKHTRYSLGTDATRRPMILLLSKNEGNATWFKFNL